MWGRRGTEEAKEETGRKDKEGGKRVRERRREKEKEKEGEGRREGGRGRKRERKGGRKKLCVVKTQKSSRRLPPSEEYGFFQDCTAWDLCHTLS